MMGLSITALRRHLATIVPAVAIMDSLAGEGGAPTCCVKVLHAECRKRVPCFISLSLDDEDETNEKHN